MEKFSEFITDAKYKNYFKSNDEIWYENLEKVKDFVELNHRRPNSNSIRR